MRVLFNRIYNDYLMGSRLTELESLLLAVRSRGYEIVSLRRFYELMTRSNGLHRGKYLVLRHDIDTDKHTARLFWELERKHAIYGSFYFRLSTVDADLMHEIEAAGAEAGYHFEEIAIVLKKGRKKYTRNELFAESASLFSENIAKLRGLTGLPISGVASHGDFVNRKIGIINNEFLDTDLRAKCGILFEAYDAEIVSKIDIRISDRMYPVFWSPEPPELSVIRGDQVIQLLIHPRQWYSAPWINTLDNVCRLIDGMKYRKLSLAE